jgi:DNA repair protein RadA/Sms
MFGLCYIVFMPKASTQYVCQSCETASSKWSGRCEACGSWNSLVETALPVTARPGSHFSKASTQKLKHIDAGKLPRLDTKITELNQVLGGGLVPGSITLLAGDPGIGKSTLVLQLAANLAAQRRVLYISGEESSLQIKLRADRLRLGDCELDLVSETQAEVAASTLEGYDLAIIDSIQTMSAANLSGSAGSVGQISASAQLIQAAAKRANVAVIMIGHVTKEGAIAGPKVLEHLVDVVLYLEGDRYGHFKALRGVKNRFGSTNEVGIFEMSDAGLMPVANPSAALLAERQPGAGSVVLATMEGTRPLLVEVQALVSPSVFGYPKRTASGIDVNRLNLLVAVLTKRAALNLSNQDVYVNIIGGLKITEPAADLAIILSIASAFKNVPVGNDLVAFGEVGLNGEIRSVSQIPRRLAEAKKLGFKKAISPHLSGATVGTVGVKTIDQAIKAFLES